MSIARASTSIAESDEEAEEEPEEELPGESFGAESDERARSEENWPGEEGPEEGLLTVYEIAVLNL